MIGVINFGMGNVRSIDNALDFLGYEAVVTNDSKKISECSKFILPGVGAFGDAIVNIRNLGLDEILHKEVIVKGKPILGICLGLQLMAKSSEEHGTHEGLGWIDADIVKFKFKPGIKIPHVGWNNILFSEPALLFEGLKESERNFYFVHSYYMECRDKQDILATCEYDIEFTAAINLNNIVGTQFHPEKSQDNGLHVLKNFLEWSF